MAIVNYYVDPSINANSGTGTIGDPYGDIQYAVDNITRDTTDGDQINVKAGTAEVMSASLDLSTYGTPAASAGLIIRGYTSTANDGGVAEFDCGGFTLCASSSVSYVDLKVHNGPASSRVLFVNVGAAHNCEVYDSYNGIYCGAYSTISNCYVYDCGKYGISHGGPSLIQACYVRTRTADSNGIMDRCIYNTGRPGIISNTIISCESTAIGIDLNQDGATCFNCSVISLAGTGSGIRLNSPATVSGCHNNLIEGFSGSGGEAIFYATAAPAEFKGIVANNTFYDCETAISNDNSIAVYKTDNSTAGGSPFKKTGSDTFANRYSYFEPDTNYAGTNLSGDGYRGAVVAAAGGGGLLRVNMNGNVFG